MKSNIKAILKYKQLYCKDQRIRNRQTIYVSREVHSQLRELTNALRSEYITTASLADSILKRHLACYKDVISEIKGGSEIDIEVEAKIDNTKEPVEESSSDTNKELSSQSSDYDAEIDEFLVDYRS